MPDAPPADLLDGLDGSARAERAELVAWLRGEHRAGEEELLRATQNGTIVLVAASRALGTGERYSAREVAARAGLPLELWLNLSRASGLPLPVDADAIHYGDTDLGVARTTRRLQEAGVGAEQLLATTRVLSRGLAQAAELMRQTVLELVLAPGLSERELAQTYAEAAEGLVPLVGPLAEQLLRLHLNHAAREEVVTAAERRAGELPGAREVAVAFADLVGFTRLGEELPPEELERVAERLVGLAAAVVSPPVRVVKSIGDAVLLICPDPVALVRAAHALVAAAEAEGDVLPQLRVGVASGPAVSRAGDWFGRPVNLASRITAVARAGSVLTDQATREAIGERGALRWSSAGERRLKGVPAPVRLHRARPAPGARA